MQVESSPEARRTVMSMFGKSCVVTGVHRIKQAARREKGARPIPLDEVMECVDLVGSVP